MNIKTRRCLSVLGVAVIVATYAAGAYRIETMRQAPRIVACGFGQCFPTGAALSALAHR